MTGEPIIRPARHEDLPEVERICAGTWEWGDYIPEVWDEWLADESGALAVAEIDGRLVALGKVTLLDGGQAWLEGMRVDPANRRQGIAWQFFQYKLDYARRHGAHIARLGTADENRAVHKMMARAGMVKAGAYVLWTAPAVDAAGAGAADAGTAGGGAAYVGAVREPPPLLAAEHAPLVRAFLRDSRVLAEPPALYSTHWAWQALSDELVTRLLAEHRVTARFAPDGSLAALALVEWENGSERLWIGLADAASRDGTWDPAPLMELARDLRALAGRVGAEKAAIMLSPLPWLRDAFAAAGYGPGDWQGELWIYEQPLAPVPDAASAQSSAGGGR